MEIHAPGFRLRSSYEVAFSPSGDLLATIGRDVTIWDVAARTVLAKNSLLRHPAHVAFSPDAGCYAIKNTSGEIILCQVPGGELIGRHRPSEADEGCRIDFSADGRYLLDGSWSGYVAARSIPDLRGEQIEQFPGHMVVDVSSSQDRRRWAFAVTAKHDHPRFAQGADSVVVRTWPGLKQLSLPGLEPWQWLWLAKMSPDGTRLALIHGRTELTVIELSGPSGQVSAPLETGGTGRALAWSPDSRLLALVEDKRFTLFRSHDLQVAATIEYPYPSDVSFSPNGRLIALGSWERGVVLPLTAVITDDSSL